MSRSASVTGQPGPDWRWLTASVLVVLADQATKALIIARFELFERVMLLPVLDIGRWHNTGAAFSMLADAGGWQNWFFTAVAVAVSAVLLWWFRQVPRGRVLVPLALALVLGGAIGNLIDRVAYGYVVDFVLLHWQAWSYPAFNVADAAITGGVGGLLYDGLVLERRRNLSASSAR